MIYHTPTRGLIRYAIDLRHAFFSRHMPRYADADIIADMPR